MKDTGAGVHGLLIVDKPSGPTSHDVVAQARRIFRTRRIGHAGTLDPLATGVLVLLFGEATKLSDIAASDDKTYLAQVCFGRATDSLDAQGQTTEQRTLPPDWLDPSALERALELERQRRHQVPPAVSAIKVAGRRAYDLTRRGSAPVLEPRAVAVSSLRLLGWSARHVELELRVSKGYYVRSLARDLGHTLGVPTHLTHLRRVQSGRFDLAEACPWPPPIAAAGQRPPIIPLVRALPRLLPILRLSAQGVERALRGQMLGASDFDEPREILDSTSAALAAWTDDRGAPIALGRREGDSFRVQRGFRADADTESHPEDHRQSAGLSPR